MRRELRLNLSFHRFTTFVFNVVIIFNIDFTSKPGINMLQKKELSNLLAEYSVLQLQAKLFVIVLSIMFSLQLSAQQFTNETDNYGISAYNGLNLFGGGISAVDYDQDGDDDLTIVLDQTIKIYRNDGGTFSQQNFGFTIEDNGKHPIWVDYDNDGDLDFFISQYLHPVKLYRNDGDFNFTEVTAAAGIAQTNVHHFGASWADYDRDGFLDLYVCVSKLAYAGDDIFDWYNHLYHNNGDGTFTDVTLESGAHDELSLTFQSIWWDYNNDNWPDLYLANDKINPNKLFKNNGDGTFEDVSEASGAGVVVDAMCASASDFNNDGWEDMFVSNTTFDETVLLRNNGDGTFTDIAESAGTVLYVTGWSGTYLDYNLDTFLDIYMCEVNLSQPHGANPFMKNNGDETFDLLQETVFPNDTMNSYSSVTGDWNNDGSPDLATNNYTPNNAALWQNSGNSNTYMKVSVEGVISNKDGIGTWIRVWSDGVMQSRFTYCGESLYSQDSKSEIFGFGSAEQTDSLILSWPSGHIDKYFGLGTNESYHFIEGGSLVAEINNSGGNTLCPNDSIILDAGSHPSYLWSTGDTTQSIVVDTAGSFWVQVSNTFGMETQSDTLEIEMAIPLQFDIITQNVSCYNGTNGMIQVMDNDSIFSISWSEPETGNTLDSIPSGTYSWEIIDIFSCVHNGEVTIVEGSEIVPSLEASDASCYGGSDGNLDITVEGGSPPYDFNFLGQDLENLSAGEYTLEISDSLGCFMSVDYSIGQADSLYVNIVSNECIDNQLMVDIDVLGGTPPYSYLWSDGSEEEDLTSTDVSATFSVSVLDSLNCEYSIGDISCTVGIEDSGKMHEPKVYPNPNNGVVFIDSNTPLERVIVWDTSGRIVFDFGKEKLSNKELNISRLSKGCYLLQIMTNSESHLEVLIRE